MRAVQKRANITTGTEPTRFQLLFSRKQALYKKLSLRAKRTSLKNFCRQTKNPYGIPYKAIVKNNIPLQTFSILWTNRKKATSSPSQTEFFKSPFQRQPHNLTEREEAFTRNEIARIMRKVPIKKAPGYDGIDFIVLKTIFRTHPEILITFYNKCLSLQCFPNPLKTGVVVIFFKKGEKTNRTLNPTAQSPSFQLWAKYWRNCFWKDSTTTSEDILRQHPNQYSFKTNRYTEEAILDLVDKKHSAKNSNQHALMISLDIEWTFDHLQYTSIKNSLDNLKYHSNTLETHIDILSNRKVAINTSQDPATWNQQQGCPKAPAQDLLSGTWWPTKCSSKTGPKGCICRHLQMISSFSSMPSQNRKSKIWPIKHYIPSRYGPTRTNLKFHWTKLIISI
ncbi:hypothetical protein AVEN_115755-1 [Araneus ventricosus]|uniref:Reverse transcriptase domain-containing protein n=1 Tax=Araneus ventricosus TaxID=182803 RepID=A0A4Y2WHA0_ARAVE|nr:hypothetical protein AVEN_115755-1 [Araneus ventricosus]